MTVEYHPAVEAELREIQRYYEERSAGLGTQFVDEFERQMLALVAAPARWIVVSGGHPAVPDEAISIYHLLPMSAE